jgi:hypothetical protein
MITLGLDPHPGTHTVVALDENGASLGHLAVPNTPEGLIQLHCLGIDCSRAVGRLRGPATISLRFSLLSYLRVRSPFSLFLRASQVNIGLAEDARKMMLSMPRMLLGRCWQILNYLSCMPLTATKTAHQYSLSR